MEIYWFLWGTMIRESWSLLHDLNNHMSLLWLCFRDFIELVGHSEKFGGANKNQKQMQLLRDTIDECKSWVCWVEIHLAKTLC